MIEYLTRHKLEIAIAVLLVICFAGAIERILYEPARLEQAQAGECPDSLPQEMPVLRQDGPEMAAYPVGDGELLVAVYRPLEGNVVLLPPAGLLSVAAVAVLSDTLELSRGDGTHVLTLIAPGDFE